MVTTGQVRQDFGLGDSANGLLFVTAAEATASDALRGQSHYMRRAFERLHLDGILCIDGVPTVYLKKFEQPVGRREINELQRKLWNQGTGTLLVVLDPSFVYVFSGMVLPSDEDGDVDSHQARVETLDRVANTLEKCQFVTRVASGQYYRENSPKFQQSNTVDRHLLENLGAVGDELRRNESPAERKRVHAFLGRIIFTCYLVDRTIIELRDYSFVRRKSVATLLDLLEPCDKPQARDLLYKLFDRLRIDFNGSMFEDDLDAEKATITDDDINTLIRFLRGDEIKSGQSSLGFWAYDFSVIPVETISAIYEKFLEEEDAATKGRQGAFYTPRHLAEMVVDEATSGLDTLIGKRCLDPACGSGIFLVILFNRIAEEIERQNPRADNQTRVNALLDVLENQLCGVDVNKTACRIACFSLYIAFLDQFDPPTLKELQQKSDKLLPKLLADKDSNYQNADSPVIYEGNFFDPALPIRDDFDVIVGNPPWVGRNQPADAAVKEWVESETHNPFLADAPRAKAKRKAIFLPQKQIAHAFMWKAPLHLNEHGCVCLLLPVQVLLNKTDAFQHAWFAKMGVYRVFNLSDFRWFLFQDANRPATIIRFGLADPAERANDTVEYIVPKVRQQDPRSGLIRVFAEDRKWVKTGDILHASRSPDDSDEDDEPAGASVFWKSLLWGSPRDVALIDYLRSLDCLGEIAGKPGEGKRWIEGQGFQPWYQISYDANPISYREPKPIPGKLADPFIRTVEDSIDMFVLPDDTITLEERLDSILCKRHPENTPRDRLKASKRGFRRSPDKRIYQPPLVLINKGFNKFAFVDFKVFYQHSLTGLHGEQNDANLLRFFTVYVRSRLAKYFSFHTAGSWGTERPEVRVHELMRLPFPLPSSADSHDDAESIVEQVALRMNQLQTEIAAEYNKARETGSFELRSQTLAESRRQEVDLLQAELEPVVFRYFKLTKEEITLIQDTCNVISQSATPTSPDKPIPTTQPTSVEDRRQYSDRLCRTLNKWSKTDQPRGRKQPFFFRAEVVPFPRVGMNLLTLHQSKKPASPIESSANGQLESVIARLNESASYSQGSFQFLRGVIFGEGNKIHILKPDMFGQWTQTAALNDADQVFHAIVQSKRK